MDTSKLITFDIYRNRYATASSYSSSRQADLKTVLRFWEDNKSHYLTKLFDDNLILTKDIYYEQSHQELCRKARNIFDENSTFINLYKQKVREALSYPDTPFWSRPSGVSEENYWKYMDLIHLIDTDAIVDNRVDGLTNSPLVINFNDQTVAIQNGMKTMKALAKISHIFGIEEEYEKFRLAQSMLTNQKKISGQLHLSIHPMDFATASDNANGWTSCMSWEDSGCYRLGTVEMMNSPMVICAYISSNNVNLSIDSEYEWNSKKWRAWVIIHPQYIFVNRHYPYHSDDIATTVLNWVKKLVKEKLGWEYGPIINNLVSYWNNQTDENPAWSDNVIISTNYMYNDIGGDDILGCMSVNHNPDNDPKFQYQVNISGPAECMYCGVRIYPYDLDDAGTLLCKECNATKVCAYCNCDLEEDSYFVSPDGDIMCEECYLNEFFQCHNCGEIGTTSRTNAVIAPFNEAPAYRWSRDSAVAYLCDSCIEFYLDKGWILPYSEYENFIFSTSEMTEQWRTAIKHGYEETGISLDNLYILNPDPHIKYEIKTLRKMFGSTINSEVCCSETFYYDFDKHIKMDVWQKNLISPLYNNEQE